MQIESDHRFEKRLEDEKFALDELIASLHSDKEKLHKDLDDASDYMHQLEDKVYVANKKCLELIAKIRSLEKEWGREIIYLKDYVGELQEFIILQ